MYVNKWICFTASVYVEACSGLAYSFSIYSVAVTKHLGLNPSQVESFALALNFGGYFAIPCGLMYDWLEPYDRLAPMITVLVGIALNVVGYVGLYAVVTGHVALPFWAVLCLAVTAANSGAWTDTSVLVTNVRNFPNQRGTVVGILKSFVGLSASIFSTLYTGLYAPHAIKCGVGYLLFLAAAPVAVWLLALPFLNHVPFVQKSELESEHTYFSTNGRMLLAYQVVVAVAAYQLTSALLSQLPLNEVTKRVLAAMTLLLLSGALSLPWGSGGLAAVPAELPADAESAGQSPPMSLSQLDFDADITAPLLEEDEKQSMPRPDSTVSVTSAFATGSAPRPGSTAGRPAHPLLQATPDLPSWQAVQTVDFWLLFWACACGMGSGLVLLNNLGQLTGALGGGTDSQVVYVSLFSIMNCGGRLIAGYIPEEALHRYGTPRPAFLALVGLVTAAASTMAAFAGLGALFPASIIAGLAFGAHWSLMPALASEVFGLAHLAGNYSLLSMAPAVGAFALATKLVGYFYGRAADPHGQCYGHHCFQAAFLVVAGLDVLAAAASALLWWRTRPIYQREYLLVHMYDEFIDDLHGPAALRLRRTHRRAVPHPHRPL